MPLKMHKIIFFPEKDVCLLVTLPKISDPLLETHLFFYLALSRVPGLPLVTAYMPIPHLEQPRYSSIFIFAYL